MSKKYKVTVEFEVLNPDEVDLKMTEEIAEHMRWQLDTLEEWGFKLGDGIKTSATEEQ